MLADIPALVKDPFLRQTGSICKQLFELLNDMAEGSTDDKIVEVAFELWLKMLHFNVCESEPLLADLFIFYVNILRSRALI